jgi:SAM-dependent methyltransferase
VNTFYDDIGVHRVMVGDEVRTQAFRDSINATVTPGDVVLDIGAGSGILSMFAARAGAARVYAVERAPRAAALARRLVFENRLQGCVHVLQVEAERVRLPERVDVLVSEWLGVYGIDENMLAPVLVARDRWLAPGGATVPGPVASWLAPVAHPAGEEAVSFHTRPYGLKLERLAPFALDEAVWLPAGATEESLRADPQRLWVVDAQLTTVAEARAPFRAEVSFRLRDSGVNGLVAWFSAAMPGGAELSNAPGRPATHWGQFLFPLAGTRHARAGDELRVTFECIPVGVRGCEHRWGARVGDGPLELHDTRRHPRPWAAPPWRPSYAGWSQAAAS